MKFRKATVWDANKVAGLLTKGFNINSIEEGKKAFLKERKKDNYLIAEEDGKIFGLLSWDMHGLPKHQLVRIERISILNTPRKDEVAEGLLTKAIQDADKFFKKKNLKLRKMYTMVHSSNKKLIDFYKKMGFIQETRIKDHYYKGIDEFFMSIFFE